MGTLHIAPGDSAAGSLRQALRDAGSGDEVLAFLDDLSCGPVDSDDPRLRASWWAPFHEGVAAEAGVRAFWADVASADGRLVVWFGRHYARELAFFHAWTDRLGERSYDIIDVTGMTYPYSRPDGSPALSRPAQGVSIISPPGLRLLLGTERPIAPGERDEYRRHWRLLKEENAPFRIATETGLASAPVDHFDAMLLQRATNAWQKIARIVGQVMIHDVEPYMQVGDIMLLARVVALVDTGRLIADGDPWQMRYCHVRLP